MQDPIKSELSTTPDDRTGLARRILRYLQTNPEAKDTLQGIAEWWLLQERIAEAVEQASNAVRWLVANGYLIEKQIPGSSVYYEINPAMRDDVLKFLTENEKID